MGEMVENVQRSYLMENRKGGCPLQFYIFFCIFASVKLAKTAVSSVSEIFVCQISLIIIYIEHIPL